MVEPAGNDLVQYYHLRAAEYDEVYRKPERQSDLAVLAAALVEAVGGSDVLELAAGTGYWTHVMAASARRVVATDINEATLEVARRRDYPSDVVAFEVADAFAPRADDADFDVVVAAFLVSHIRRRELAGFVSGVLDRVRPDARVILLDNNFVEGSNHPITRRDEEGNTFQVRRLRDGSSFEVLKNFYSQSELRQVAGRRGEVLNLVDLKYYWLIELATSSGHDSSG